MNDIEKKMDEILLAEPELTLRDVLAELVKKGELTYDAISDDRVQSWLHVRFVRAKVRAGAGRVNTDM